VIQLVQKFHNPSKHEIGPTKHGNYATRLLWPKNKSLNLINGTSKTCVITMEVEGTVSHFYNQHQQRKNSRYEDINKFWKRKSFLSFLHPHQAANKFHLISQKPNRFSWFQFFCLGGIEIFHYINQHFIQTNPHTQVVLYNPPPSEKHTQLIFWIFCWYKIRVKRIYLISSSPIRVKWDRKFSLHKPPTHIE